MCSLAIERRFSTVHHSVVTDDAGDAEAVVGEYSSPALCLDGAMGGSVPPSGDGGLVAPEGKRQELARLDEALVSLDREETIDAVHLGSKRCGKVKVSGLLARRRPRLEQHSNHGRTNGACGADESLRKILSSRRMNRSRWLNA